MDGELEAGLPGGLTTRYSMATNRWPTAKDGGRISLLRVSAVQNLVQTCPKLRVNRHSGSRAVWPAIGPVCACIGCGMPHVGIPR